jgi:hypothetical protein
MPGRTTTSIPNIPAATAAQRRGPMVSPRSGMDKIVISRGDRKLMVVACAIVICRTP